MSSRRPSAPYDAANIGVWSSSAAVDDFARAEGWTDPGEQAAVTSLAPLVRGASMLDLGMGGGRTTSWALLLTDDYVGVDVAAEMVAAARRRHPGVAFRLGDARNLREFDDGQFGFVMFSNNGIDAVGHDDRRTELKEIARVLRPGGHALISTCNRDSADFLTTPWHRGRVDADDAQPLELPRHRHARRDRLEQVVHRVLQVGSDPMLPIRRAVSWRRMRRFREDHADYSMAPLDAYGFGLLIHWTTLPAACAELEAAGLQVTAVFRSDNGARVDPADWHRARAVTCHYVHLVAERGPVTA